MKKQLLSLLLALILVLAAAIPAALAEDDSPTSDTGYYYVYPENGKGLNVRNSPGGDIVGSLKYGTKIFCYYRDNGTGWALIDYSYNMPGVGYGTYACFISNRYLQKSKPPAKPAEPSSDTSGTDTIDDINAQYRSAVRVDPFTVTVRPSRASGWVNMRWAPGKSAEIMATYKANERLLVIRELRDWYQVEDQDTGDVGFIMKQYTVK